MKDREISPMKTALVIAGLAICAVTAAHAGEGGYSYGGIQGKSDPCLACHGNDRIVAPEHRIDPRRYNHTSHARIGCAACHDNVSTEHPADGAKPSRTACSQCHGDRAEEYSLSRHAGKASCSDCHDPHRVSDAEEISGQEMNKMCARCHGKGAMEARHARWLPQAGLHLEMIPCVACHTGSANYLISLHIIKRDGDNPYGEFRLATYAELKKSAPGGKVRSLVDADGNGAVSVAELRRFNERADQRLLRLQGIMVPEQVSHDFRTLDSRWDCTFCHASGPGAMQRSVLALPEQNGTFTRIEVERGAVLAALGSTPDFYMTGATRNSTLNVVGLAIIAGGLVMPVGHGFLRFLTRKNRRERSHRHE